MLFFLPLFIYRFGCLFPFAPFPSLLQMSALFICLAWGNSRGWPTEHCCRLLAWLFIFAGVESGHGWGPSVDAVEQKMVIPGEEKHTPRLWMMHKTRGELVTRDDPAGRPTVFQRLARLGLPDTLMPVVRASSWPLAMRAAHRSVPCRVRIYCVCASVSSRGFAIGPYFAVRYPTNPEGQRPD